MFRNWLEEGYYEEDEWGNMTQLTDPKEILRAQREGTLYENDGMATTKVYENEEITIKIKNKYE